MSYIKGKREYTFYNDKGEKVITVVAHMFIYYRSDLGLTS